MTVKLTIDGRSVEVEDGATILDAARKLGIEIPTLCHLDGLPPASSCLICVVRVDRRPNLIPSCVALAEEGMVVTATSDEILAARKAALELLLSDHVGDCVAPCTLACPAGLDIPAMIRDIRDGRHERALAVIRQRIPLPGVLGRICPRFCERVCRRGDLDEPIAICALKRFPADVADIHAGAPLAKQPTGKRVAVLGAGPAGLSAAFYLLQEGHACTVFDAHPEPGGMLRYAVPQFRLPRHALEKDIEAIRQLGAEFRVNTLIGEDLEFAQIRGEYHAVLLALGAGGTQQMDCEGAQSAILASAFLHDAACGRRTKMSGAVAVLGGGEEAIDAARTAIRLGAQRVTVVWQRDRKAMPCFAEWVAAAEAEGVQLELSAKPVRIEKESMNRLKVVCRRNGGDFALETSCVIAAPERSVDVAFAESLGLAVTRRGVSVDRNTLAATIDGVFAAGEIVSGPAAAVRAVRAGRLAAMSINQYLKGEPFIGPEKHVNVLMSNLDDREREALYEGREKAPRRQQSVLPAHTRRTNFDEIVAGFDETEAIGEASRCLDCDCLAKESCKLRRYATAYGASPRKFRGERRPFERDASHPEIVYEGGKCIMCGLCVRTAAQTGERPGITFVGRGFTAKATVPFGRMVVEGLPQAARRCAAACPTGALAMKTEEAESGD